MEKVNTLPPIEAGALKTGAVWPVFRAAWDGAAIKPSIKAGRIANFIRSPMGGAVRYSLAWPFGNAGGMLSSVIGAGASEFRPLAAEVFNAYCPVGSNGKARRPCIQIRA